MGRKMRWISTAMTLALAATAIGLLAASSAQPAAGDLADLALTKADNPDPVTVGSTLTYTIQVTNQGPKEATEVVVTDKLPSHTDYVSATPTSGNCNHNGVQVTCKLGNLTVSPATGSSATVTIVVKPTKAGTLTNTASVASVETDPVTANNESTATTTVAKAPSPPQAASCRGVRATVTGTSGSDHLVGTGGNDVIAGLGGNDEILGLAGRDLICAGAGRDRVNGGSAGDRVFGGKGPDHLLGRGGPDLLAGNAGNDVLKGGPGNDRLLGGSGVDRCEGGAGRDTERSCEG